MENMPESLTHHQFWKRYIHTSDLTQQTPEFRTATLREISTDLNQESFKNFLYSNKMSKFFNHRTKITDIIDLHDCNDMKLKIEIKNNYEERKLDFDYYRFDFDFDLKDYLQKFNFTESSTIAIEVNDFLDFKSNFWLTEIGRYQEYLPEARHMPIVNDYDVNFFKYLVSEKLEKVDNGEIVDFRLNTKEIFGWEKEKLTPWYE